MDQEKIGKFIKDIRIKDGLSQAKFAEKYGVTYQAVSKWENGKNIPDLAILKQMCIDYNMNLDDFLDTKISLKKKKKIFYIPILIFASIIISLLVYLLLREENFEFKSLSPTCDNFKLYGSIAYNDKKSSIHISNIIYCGESDDNLYKKLDCSLYEIDEKKQTLIDKYTYEEAKNITLSEFLEEVHFVIDDYEKTCRVYKEDSLFLEIEALDMNDKITKYKIPLKLDDSCKK